MLSLQKSIVVLLLVFGMNNILFANTVCVTNNLFNTAQLKFPSEEQVIPVLSYQHRCVELGSTPMPTLSVMITHQLVPGERFVADMEVDIPSEKCAHVTLNADHTVTMQSC